MGYLLEEYDTFWAVKVLNNERASYVKEVSPIVNIYHRLLCNACKCLYFYLF